MVTNQVTIDDFELLKVIGKGTYGKVFLVRKKDTNEFMAMKTLKKSILSQKNQVEHTRAERNILARIRHPFVVKLHYAFHNQKKLYFILEYCQGGELFFHLSKARLFDENRAKFYAACIVLALEELHKHGVVYRDLKPENVLIDSSGYAKLTDFGLSKENITDNASARTFCGTPEYLAPEVVQKKGHGRAVDWWSLGCIIFEMLTGLPPFYVENKCEVYRKVVCEDAKYPEDLTPTTLHLLRSLLKKDPYQRLGSEGGAEEVKAHIWFCDINWEALYNRQVTPPFVPVLEGQGDFRYVDEVFLRSPPRDSVYLQGGSPCSSTFEGFSYQGSPTSEFEIKMKDENEWFFG